jgi:hypothetical protein
MLGKIVNFPEQMSVFQRRKQFIKIGDTLFNVNKISTFTCTDMSCTLKTTDGETHNYKCFIPHVLSDQPIPLYYDALEEYKALH